MFVVTATWNIGVIDQREFHTLDEAREFADWASFNGATIDFDSTEEAESETWRAAG